MTVSHPNQHVCLLRKAISIPLGHGNGSLVKGELVTIINNQGEDCTISLLMDSSQVYTCQEKNLKLVPYDIVKYLLPVFPCSKRYEVFTKLDRDLLNLPLGSHVNITRGRTSPTVLGELKYKGELKDRVGIWFGLKLVGTSNCGESDGSINGVYYMDRCPTNSVIFATVDELALKGPDNNSDNLLLLSNMGDIKEKTSHKVAKTLPIRTRKSEPKSNQLTCNYTEGDEVIVLRNKHAAEAGIVRAVFQDAKKRWMLGVELDNPVGDTNGIFKGRQMFSCDSHHGIFCETTEAMPKHYYESPSRGNSPTLNTLPSHTRSSSHPASSYGAPPPSYNDSFNSYPATAPKSPRPRVKSPKMDFEAAFKSKTAAATSAIAQLPTDLVQSINTLAIAGGTHIESPEQPSTSNRIEQPSTSNRVELPSTSNRVELPSKHKHSPKNSPKNSPETPEPPPDIDLSLEVGSMVQVSKGAVVHYGVLRWIGNLPGKRYVCAGLELEEEISPPGNDGCYDGVRYFTCPPFRALFCYLHDCRPDRRFEELPVQQKIKQYFGPQESPVIEGRVDPPKHIGPMYLGRSRGIQGNKNSCYLDATLYAMFAFDNTMDYVLSAPVEGPVNAEIQRKLKECVVNPLRDGGFVGAEHMRVLRDLLSRSSTLGGLETEEKEPEELLNVLFTEIFNIKPLLSFRDGATGEISHVNLCQILLERDGYSSTMPQTQDLLTRYFVSQNLYFHSQPQLLLLQVPRSGKDFKLYDTVLPSTELQLGGLCGGVWGSCYICNKKPHYKCPQCYLNQEFKCKFSAVPYCDSCCKLVHKHPARADHDPERATNPTRGIKMVLSAVLCIHTSHYVTYCRVPAPPDPGESVAGPSNYPQTVDELLSTTPTDPTPLQHQQQQQQQQYCWVFFDSMADREGGIGGYNIPQVQECPELEEWLQNPAKLLHEKDRAPDFVKRLIEDALLCFYTKDENS